jgi:ATP-dependent exoDNAse (exonuclease V) alpha subunit
VGHPVRIYAPQHQQAADLRRDGLDADTVARLLAFTSHVPLQRGTVIVVDEAGQIGGKDMLRIIEAARVCGGRVILSGDTRQQGAVAASDALRILETQTGLVPVKLDTIRRQNPDAVASDEQKREVRDYRAAVEAAADGRLTESLKKLEQLGWVREAEAETLIKEIATHYREATQRQENALAVTQTWEAVHSLNDAIRVELKRAGILKDDTSVASWQAVNLTEAQKRDARFYAAGEGVFFLRDYGRYQRGDFCEIVSADERGVTLRKNGRDTAVSYNNAAACLAPVRTREIELARGDRLQLKFNGKSVEDLPIRNGELATVLRVMRDGRIHVRDDSGVCKTLAATQRMFVHGYAVTTYASQGKTVDTVLLHSAGEEAKPAAVNRNQWYVGISRARKQALVFTNDLTALRTRIEHESSRAPAVSLAIDETAQARLRESIDKEHLRIVEAHYNGLRTTHATHAPHVAPNPAQTQHPLSHEYQPPQQTPKKGISV